MNETRKTIALFFYRDDPEEIKATTLRLISSLQDEFDFLILLLEEVNAFPKLSEELQEEGIFHERVVYRSRPGLRECREIRRILEDRSIQVIQSFNPDADFWCYLLKRFMPQLCWIGESDAPKSNWLSKRVSQSKNWVIHRSAETQATVSESAGKSQQDFLVYSVGMQNSLYQSLVPDPKTIRFVFSGEFSQQTGVMDVLRAFVLLRANRKGLKLLLAGSGEQTGSIYDVIYENSLQMDVELRKEQLGTEFVFSPHDVYVCSQQNIEDCVLLDLALQSGVNLLAVDSAAWKGFFAKQPVDVFFRGGDPFDLHQKMRLFVEGDFAERQSLAIEEFARVQLPEYNCLKRFRELYRVV